MINILHVQKMSYYFFVFRIVIKNNNCFCVNVSLCVLFLIKYKALLLYYLVLTFEYILYYIQIYIFFLIYNLLNNILYI